MNDERLQQQAAAKFAKDWEGKGYEKGQSQTFWLTLLSKVLGVKEPENIITFEDQVHLDHTSFIDGFIHSTKVMIEQKGLGKDLLKPIRQSDGTTLTPFQQAKRYAAELPYSKRPRWIVTCNFSTFHVYDMEHPQDEPFVIELKNLEKEYYRLHFLVETEADHLQKELAVSMQAGELVGKLYNLLLEQYQNPNDHTTLRHLNILCVRLVFCLYCEDAGVFGKHDMFHNYLAHYVSDLSVARAALISLFDVLNTPVAERDPYMNERLAAFPYCAGNLFEEEIVIPRFTPEILDMLLEQASLGFDWSQISPTIFGAVFESTLNPVTRRTGGMHYTSVENIHKVIDPLFLNDLKDELASVRRIKTEKIRRKALYEFQDKLSKLHFLDPACGSGNFLTETYISLRRLENEVIADLNRGNMMLGDLIDPVKVNINQFYGIEINDFAATVATTALWISEAQMLHETERIMQREIEFLPLKNYSNIHEGNALRTDWQQVCPSTQLSYIMGNPPFIGARMMAQGSEQKNDIETLFGKIKDVQDLDYVTGWYYKAAEYIQNTNIEVGFVSTNSICQGAQVPILWKVMFNKFHLSINFAYQTFKWSSEASEKAAVHCVIIGFSTFERKRKLIFEKSSSTPTEVKHISPYLFEGGNTVIEASKNPICDVPKMCFGNQPRDGGHFVLSTEQKEQVISQDPTIEKFIHPYIGAEEFIKGKERWCFWLKGITPAELKSHKILYDIVCKVREFRLASRAKTTNGYAKVPHLFAQITQPEGKDYILVPRVSSENRVYIPIGFNTANVVASDAVQIIPDASLYHFGVLESSVHMAWMRVVCGRLKSDYRYSKDIVYNNFPWPKVTEAQRAKIESTAQAILDARRLYPDSSLADLYDDVTMPIELRKAHTANDIAVLEAYGLPKSTAEPAIVAHLFTLTAH